MHRMKTRRPSLIRSLEPMLSAFHNLRGFEQRDLMATLGPLPQSAGSDGNMLRAIQCEEDGSYALVRLEGSPKATWVRRYKRMLLNAGYRVRARLPDEIAMVRWILDKGDLVQELRFLARLGGGKGVPLPRRAPRQRTQRGRRSPREWLALFETIRDARLGLDSCATSFRRMGPLSGDKETSVEVRAVAIRDAGRKLGVHLLVSLSAATPVVESVLTDLEARGYKRSSYRDTYCAIRAFYSVPRAAHESQRVFATLAGVVPTPRREPRR